MRSRVVRGRLVVLSAGMVLVTLAACGPDISTAPQPEATQIQPETEQPATPPAGSKGLAASAPVNSLDPPTGAVEAIHNIGQTPAAAEDTVRGYYAAINAKDYLAAYKLWSNAGAASRQSFEGFSGGYAGTDEVVATVGRAFDQQGAAGSRYTQVPVDLTSRRHDGSERHYRGSFTLRASVADGASPQERQWHLDSADLEGYQPQAIAPAQHAQM